jgi:hypothetical protein
MTTHLDLFGALAVKNGFVSTSEVELALEAQKEGPAFENDAPHKLGEILAEMGTLTPSQIQTVLDAQARLRQSEAAAPVQFQEIPIATLIQESGPAILINDQPLTEARPLKAGDLLQSGDLRLRFTEGSLEIRPKPVPAAEAPPDSSTTCLPAIARPATEAPPAVPPAPKVSLWAKLLPALRAVDGLIARIPPASLHTQRKYVLAGAFVGCIALLLPWRSAANGNTVMGIQGPGWLQALLLLVPVGATLFSRATEPFTRVERIASTAAAGLALAIGVIKVVYPGRAFGLFIGLFATACVLAAGVFARAGGTGAASDGTTLGARLWKKLSGFLGSMSGRRAKDLHAAIETRDGLLKKIGEAALEAHPALPESAAAVQARDALSKLDPQAGEVRAKAALKAADAKAKRAFAKLAQKALDGNLPLAGQESAIAELRAAEAKIKELSQ